MKLVAYQSADDITPVYTQTSDAAYVLGHVHDAGTAHGTKSQSLPCGSGINVTQAVMEDLQARMEHGTRIYGTPLHTHNGRDALIDAYQEVLDLACYLKQVLLERDTHAV